MIARYTRPAMGRIFADETKVAGWLAVERAALEALVAAGIAPAEAASALRVVGEVDPEVVALREREVHHDLAAFVDVVGERAPDAAPWLHHGLTSSDVLDTALALQLRSAGELILEGVDAARAAIEQRALQHRSAVMLGRTHGRAAEPTTFGVVLAGWCHQLGRDARRLRSAFGDAAAGTLSGAVGTHAHLPVDVERRALAALGLSVDEGATQIVQRDRIAAVMQSLALCAASLERFATCLRLLQQTGVEEVFEPFAAGQKGSSAMPHKRNPIVAERICGLARVVRAHASIALENVAVWAERDISHSSAERIVIPDACCALDYMLDRFTWIVDGLEVDERRMRANLDAERGLPMSQHALLALTRSGWPRDRAYRSVQRAALRVAESQALTLAEALGDDADVVAAIGDPHELLQPERALAGCDAIIARLPS